MRSKPLMKKGGLIFYIGLLALPLIQFLIFYVVVNANSFLLAFQSYDVVSGGGFGTFRFTGWETFKELFRSFKTNPYLPIAFKNSFLAYFISLIVSTPLALFFSYYIYKKMPCSAFFRIILFLPSIIPVVVLSGLYTQLCESIIPKIVRMSGGELTGYLSDENTVFAALVFFSIFISFGTASLLYVGSMTGISDSVVEAAKLDGANVIQEFLYITFPMIYPTFSTLTIVGLAGIFTNQWNAFAFFSDKATGKAYTVGYFIYVNSLDAYRSQYPMVAAFGILLTLFIVPVTMLVRKLLGLYGGTDNGKV